MKIVGLSGKSGSGKDYFANGVFRIHHYKPWAFAWPMKNEACGHGFTYEDVHVHKPPAVREFLQKRGTEDGWMKHGRNYWCRITEAWLRTLEFDRVVIKDVRFPHEAEWVRHVGGKLVRLELGMGLRGLEGDAAGHSSETALDDWTDWDVRFVNNTDAGSTVQFGMALASAGVL